MAIIVVSPEAIANAAQRLLAGELVAFPTETVYGLGADATNGQAVARIFAVKGRPHFNPLIAHVADLAAAETIAIFDDRARALARAFWPGPLTMVLPRRQAGGSSNTGAPPVFVSDLMTAGLDTIAVRVPSHPVARALLRAAGVPVAAPSANRSGRVSPTTAGHVASDFGEDVAWILDGGRCVHGLESTIVTFEANPSAGSQAGRAQNTVILRTGAVTAEQIEAVIGDPVNAPKPQMQQAPAAPGQLASHYAPSARVRLAAADVAHNEALLAFGRALSTSRPSFNLSPAGNLIEAAANLFEALRRLDRPGIDCIAVMPIPHTGIGAAINDRLKRAAAPR
jgi:L-threonylcarbamoyladenylate synthase